MASIWPALSDALLCACLRALHAALVRLREALDAANATLGELAQAPAPLAPGPPRPLRVLSVGINYTQAPERLSLRGCGRDAVRNATHWTLLGARSGVVVTDEDDARILGSYPRDTRVTVLHASLTLPVLEEALHVTLEGAASADGDARRPPELLQFPAAFAPIGQQDDAIVITLSCHGDQRKDENGDENDGFDEGLVLSDEKMLADDVLARMAMRSLEQHPSRRIFFFMDFCHSGTAADQPHVYDPTTRRWRDARDGTSVPVQDVPPLLREQGIVAVLSGCQPGGQSFEQAGVDGEVEGIFSEAVRRNVRDLGTPVLQCFERVAAQVAAHAHITQQPLLCSSVPFNETLTFLDAASESAQR